MPAAVTVWAVELGRGPEDRKGLLSLEADALRFEAAEGSSRIVIPFAQLHKVKRLHGSPVLMTVHREEGRIMRTAFYFVQPPPLDPTKSRRPEQPPNAFSAMTRPSKRKRKRENAGYLGLWNREKKQLVADWADAIRSAAAARR